MLVGKKGFKGRLQKTSEPEKSVSLKVLIRCHVYLIF